MSATPHHRVYIGLGANLGDRLENLRAARTALGDALGAARGHRTQVLAVSPVYQTPPWGFANQPAFLNQVILIETTLSPWGLLEFLKKVEGDLGRQPSFRYGPRLIDLDILFYDELTLDVPGLAIPHPRLAGRAFVLKPLADLAPDLRHPILNRTIQELLGDVDVAEIEVFEDNDGHLD